MWMTRAPSFNATRLAHSQDRQRSEPRFGLFRVFDGVVFVDARQRVSHFRSQYFERAHGGADSDFVYPESLRHSKVLLWSKLNRRPGEKASAFFFSIGQAF